MLLGIGQEGAWHEHGWHAYIHGQSKQSDKAPTMINHAWENKKESDVGTCSSFSSGSI